MLQAATIEFVSYAESVPVLLDRIGARDILARQQAVLLKPNLVNTSPPPVTTPVALCEAVLEYVRACSQAEIVIAEGCGDADHETAEVFSLLGYEEMAMRHNLTLVDLNKAPLTKRTDRVCPVFPVMYLPEIAFSHFIISLPVLKAHSLAVVSGTLKNMMGFAPPRYYSGRCGIWKKAVFHEKMHQAIMDLNRYRAADLSLIDATVGLAEYHLGGPACYPPVNKLVAGFNPLAVDREAARLLGRDWCCIPHLASDER